MNLTVCFIPRNMKQSNIRTPTITHNTHTKTHSCAVYHNAFNSICKQFIGNDRCIDLILL